MIRCWASPLLPQRQLANFGLAIRRGVRVKVRRREVDRAPVEGERDVERRAAAAQQPRLARIQGKRDKIMLPIPVVAPESVSNFHAQVLPVYAAPCSAAIVTGSSVFLLQLVFRSISFSDTTSGLNLTIHVTRRADPRRRQCRRLRGGYSSAEPGVSSNWREGQPVDGVAAPP